MDRPITVKSAAGDDVLLFHRMTGTEEMSRPFEFHVDLLTQTEDIVLHELVGQPMTIKLTVGEDSDRYFNGIVSRFAFTGSEGDYHTYRAVLRPWLWRLTRRSDCRIFQEQTAPEIIKAVFRDAGFSDFEEALNGEYRTWKYCVQYRETDFNFVSRLMEQEGIFYFFKHEDGKHTLVLADGVSSLAPYEGFEELTFFPPGESAGPDASRVNSWEVAQEYQTNIFAHTDYDFIEPTKDLSAKSQIPRDHVDANTEIYDYPGEYWDPGEGDTYAKIRIEELQAQYERCTGEGDVPGICVGSLFDLIKHPRDDQNREYLVLATRHALEAGKYESGGKEAGANYSVQFSVIPSAIAYRPRRVTPKPVVQGPQTAVVVGPSGETVWCDEYGRVKVQFHWDREGQRDENSSCWVRVSNPSAGANWGGMFLPHVGHEVIVEFLEGDPDRPIVTGRVYNADNMPPRPLPDEKYVSALRDHFGNELVLDGTPGGEHLMLRSPSHNSTLFLGKSSVLVTASDGHEWTMGDKYVRFMGDYTSTKIGDSWSAFHGNSFSQYFGISTSLSIAAKQSVDVGTSASFTAGFSVSGTVGVKASFHKGKDVSLGSQSYTKSVDKNITMDSNKTFKAVGGPRDQSILRLAPDEATLTFGQGDDAAGSSSAKVAFLAGVMAAAGAAGASLYGSNASSNATQQAMLKKKNGAGFKDQAEENEWLKAARDAEYDWKYEWAPTALPIAVMLGAAAIEAVTKARAANDKAKEANGVKAMIRANKDGVVLAAGANLESAEPYNAIKMYPKGKIVMSSKKTAKFKANKQIEMYADGNKTTQKKKWFQFGKGVKQKNFKAE